MRFEEGTKMQDGKDEEEPSRVLKDLLNRKSAFQPVVAAKDKKKPKKDKKKSKKTSRKRVRDENQIEVKPYPVCEERKWDDGKNRRMATGAFTDREVVLLRNAICEYAKENQLENEALKDLIEGSSTEKTYTRAWVDISKCLRK